MLNEKNFSENGLIKLKKRFHLIALETISEKNFATDSIKKRFEKKVAEFKNQELNTDLKRKSSSEYAEKKQNIKITDTFTKVTSKKDLNMNSPVAKKKKTSE